MHLASMSESRREHNSGYDLPAGSCGLNFFVAQGIGGLGAALPRNVDADSEIQMLYKMAEPTETGDVKGTIAPLEA